MFGPRATALPDARHETPIQEARKSALAAACPRCGGRVFFDGDGEFCAACRATPEVDSRAVAYVLAGGAGTRLEALARGRAKPALPFGGTHRLIDFTLANCVNSGVEDVMVLTQHHADSVRAALDLRIEPERPGRLPLRLRVAEAPAGTPTGTAGAVRRMLGFIGETAAKSVLVLSADHVYEMDYRPFIARHVASRADLTIAATPVDEVDARRFGIVDIDDVRRVRAFIEKPEQPRPALASMGVYAFAATALRLLLEDDAANEASVHDFGHSIIPLALRRGLAVHAYEFDGYWRDVGTVDAYWSASMDMLRGAGPTDGKSWPLLARSEYRGSVRLAASAELDGALLAGSCAIAGCVRRSIVFPGARVEPGATVTDSILLPGAVVERDAVVTRAIADEEAVVGEGARFGERTGPIVVLPAGSHVSPARRPQRSPSARRQRSLAGWKSPR